MEPLRPDDPVRIDKYQLIGRLGQGGMGRVYFARSPAGKLVAVKVINPEHADNSEFRRRFVLEVAAARKVSGAFTAAVVDAGPDDTPPWLAIEFVFGPTLAHAVTPGQPGKPRTPLPPDAVWSLAGGLVEALRAVHACDLVHRDLKPGNVLLDVNGPRVIDFGIARGLTSAGGTMPGFALGTYGYMSPEQSGAMPAGPQSDVFSLGCVLVFAATGAAPVTDSGGVAVREQPALRDVPTELRSLVHSCLAPFPERRPSPDELLTRIQIGRSRYPQAPGLDFWPPAVDSLVRSEGERIRRYLATNFGASGRKPSYTPTEVNRGARGGAEAVGEAGTQSARRPHPVPFPDDSLFTAYRPKSAGGGVIHRRPGEMLDSAGHALEAERHLERRRYTAAEDAYRASLSLNRKDPVVHVDLGRTLYLLLRHGDAETAFIDALRLAPDMVAARRNLYIVVKRATGRSQEAERLHAELKQACHEVIGLDHDPSDVASWANVGDACCCLGRLDEAVHSYQTALKLDPDNQRLLEKLDYAMRRTG
jgi:serine/threonine protein kinase